MTDSAKRETSRSEAIMGYCLVGLLGLGVFFWAVVWGPESRPPVLPLLNSKVAYDACGHFVTRTLDTPSTAKFPGRFDSTTTVGESNNEGSTVYHVRSYVDAQNKFGAVVRTRFLCAVVWDRGAKKWNLLELSGAPWTETSGEP